jgi:iron complex outermembrane receptor protein
VEADLEASAVAADSDQAEEAQVAVGKSLITTMFLTLFLAITAFSQSNTASTDTLRATLEPVYVTVGRNFTLDQQTPFSVSISRRSEVDRVTTTLNGTESLLSGIAGVFVANRENYSLGERLSIRGSGWRASFGVRGVQVLVDGLPLTSPDGQTILELVDPNLIRESQVIRGPSALFWGNGSGGTLYFNTQSLPDDPMLTLRSSVGSYGQFQNDATVRTAIGETDVRFSVSDFRTDGYREHSKAHISRINLGVDRTFAGNQALRYQLFGITAPDIKNPGSLNQTVFDSDPASANPQFISQQAGKSYDHLIHGLTYSKQTQNTSFESVLFNTFRSLENPISPSIIEIERVNVGSRNSFQYRTNGLKLSFSADAAYQSDDRKNWVNQSGSKGNLTVDQIETVGSFGLAAIAQYTRNDISVTTGIRSDLLYFEADDAFGGQNDASGARWMSALSPQIGITYQFGLNTLYSGVTTSFESPTTTELVNRPDLSRGFNEDLQPERSVGFEIGLRGQMLRYSLEYDVALFRIHVRDRLSSFQTDAGGDRTFYENIGATIQQGLEVMLNWSPTSSTSFGTAYTLSDFTFDEENSTTDGNVLPGIPVHSVKLQVAKELRGFRVVADGTYNSKLYTNNANSAVTNSYSLINLNVSKSINLSDSTVLVPYASVKNIFDEKYSSSVSINAFGNRFYEPGMPRNFTIGVSLMMK